jgi:hypothetical protein
MFLLFVMDASSTYVLEDSRDGSPLSVVFVGSVKQQFLPSSDAFADETMKVNLSGGHAGLGSDVVSGLKSGELSPEEGGTSGVQDLRFCSVQALFVHSLFLGCNQQFPSFLFLPMLHSTYQFEVLDLHRACTIGSSPSFLCQLSTKSTTLWFRFFNVVIPLFFFC